MYITQEWFNVNLVRNFVTMDTPATLNGSEVTKEDCDGNMVPVMTTSCVAYDTSVNPTGSEGQKTEFSW